MNKQTSFRSTASAVILATVLGFGAAAVWLFVAMWVGFFYAMFFAESQSNTQLLFTVDGEALLVTSEPSLLPTTLVYKLPNGALRSEASSLRYLFRTLDGKPVEHPALLQGDASGTVLPGPALRSHLGGLAGTTFSYLSKRPPTFWYLILSHDEGGRAYFEGFDPQTKLRVGYLGTRGFSAELPRLEEQFAIPDRLWPAGSREPDPGTADSEPYNGYDSAQYVISGDKAYLVDFDNRTATPVDLPDRVVALGRTAKPKTREEGSKVDFEALTLIRLPEAIRYLDGRSIPIPEAIRDQNLTLTSTLTDEVILVGQHQWTSDRQIYWIDAEGKVRRHATVPHDPSERTSSDGWTSAVGAPAPALLAILMFVNMPIARVANGSEPDFATALAATIRQAWVPFAVVCLLSAVLAVWCYLRHRRYSERGAAGWAIFVLLFGVPGLIGYLLHRQWPARARCAGCGAMVPRDRSTCMACAGEFPRLALKGSEVFA